MRRCPFGVEYIGTATFSISSAIMSLRPPFRGGRCWSQGPGRGWRNYSDRPLGDCRDYFPQFVTGDTHFHQVREANQGFRPQYDGGSYRNFPPPSSFSYSHPNYRNVPPSTQHHFDHNRQFDRAQPPQQSLSNQQFRLPQQQFRPRPPKNLEYRNWEYAAPAPPPNCERFTILSYNILADYLVRDHWNKLYFHIPNFLLDWKQRKRSIIFELGLWSADILCFQEVDRFEDLKEDLELRGYNGIWKRRTGVPMDGCAIFWRSSRFKLLHEESIEFGKLGLRDNVAQICVFQSLDQGKDNETSASTSSSSDGNKVVICNIHVLFNPKRGEIKLGQVRVLLNKAHAVSTLWDNAPIVLCGDFNSTPKSALYNFIAEQKLDLSELPRDKVSGQACAEIHPSRPYNPNYSGAHYAGNSVPASPSRRAEVPGTNRGTEPSAHVNQPDFGVLRDSVEDRNNDEIDADAHNDLEENPRRLLDEASFSHSLSSEVIDQPTSQKSFSKDAKSEFSSDGDKYIEYQCCSKSIEHSGSCKGSTGTSVKNELSFAASFDQNFIKCYEGSSGMEFSSFPSPNSVTTSLPRPVDMISSSPPSSAVDKVCTSTACSSDEYDVLPESLNRELQVDEQMKSLSLDEGTTEGESIGVDEKSFLAELHSTSGTFPSCSNQLQTNVELGKSFEELNRSKGLLSGLANEEVLDGTDDLDTQNITAEQSRYDPSAWTPVELETATGSAMCTSMEHPLKLQSVYGEIQDYSGTRDSTGEPAVTSYHRRFLGTVDYIWRSGGLQTVKVLAPIPKHAMLWTRGFPTKKWGSDHIALVSELAFTKDVSNQNPESRPEIKS